MPGSGTVQPRALARRWLRRPGRTMAELLRSLQDSQLVARFQRRCGLFPAPDEGAREDDASPAEGAARAPGVGHRPTANGKGGGAPANWRCGVPAPQAYVQKYVVKNYFYYYLFRFSAALGQEVFYVTFLPFTHWNIDSYLSRRLIVIWVVSIATTHHRCSFCNNDLPWSSSTSHIFSFFITWR